jgi:hypothetical protein
MKNVIPAPAPEKGRGHTQGGAKAPKTRTKKTPRKAAVEAAAPQQPRYNEGLRYDTPGLRYAVGEPATLPPTDGAKVKMSLNSRNNENLDAFTANHITSMAGNAYYPVPLPTVAEFGAVYTDYHTKLTAWLAAQTALRDAATALEAARVQMVDSLNARAGYVQSASNGNTNAIVSSGFEVRNAPTPTGPLPPPININIDLNGVAGVMKIRWQPVDGARGYLVECSEDVQPRVWQQIKNTTRASLFLENMELGQTYVFRIASQGGSTGQSPWSPEVIRGAA